MTGLSSVKGLVGVNSKCGILFKLISCHLFTHYRHVLSVNLYFYNYQVGIPREEEEEEGDVEA